MLKKILIVVAVIVVAAGSFVGYEAYHYWKVAGGIFVQQPQGTTACSSGSVHAYQTLPKLLPWTRSAQLASSTTPSKGTKVTDCIDPGTESSLTGTKRINILLLGTDTDCKFTKIGILTQTVFVVTIDPVHKTIGMLSIPRDSWLPIPGSTIGDPYTYAKMDQAFEVGEEQAAATSSNQGTIFRGGLNYAESTIENNFGIHIDQSAWVGLDGFVKVINTLGGVDINAIHPMLDDSYPGDLLQGGCNGFSRVYIPAGPQHQNGSIALQYVRTRHSDLEGDLGRGERQLQMIEALKPKIDALGLTNFLTLTSLFDDVNGYVKTTIPLNEAGSFVSFAKNLNLSHIHKLILSGSYSSFAVQPSPAGNQDVVELNWNEVLPAVEKMFAPIVVKKRHHHKNRPIYVSAQQADVYLSHVSGAIAQPPNQSVPTYSGSLDGTIYFGDNGNLWKDSSSGVQQVTSTTALASGTVTGNGHKIAFYRRWSQNNADVWIENLQTRSLKQITRSREGDGYLSDAYSCNDYPFCGYVWNVNPVISPNGHTVIYESDAYKDPSTDNLTLNSDCATSWDNNGIDLALYAYNTRTHVSQQISVPCWGAGGDTEARFDPVNPNQIVYTEFYYINAKVGSRLVVLNLKTGVRHRISPYHSRCMQATWSANGKEMAWLGASDQSTTIYIAPYRHGRLARKRKVVVDTGLISQPTFSPDGKHLVYYKLVGDTFQMFIVNLVNGKPEGKPMLLLNKSDLTASGAITWVK